MQIEISKKQYEDIINFLGVAEFIYGILGDMVSDKYKKISDRLDEIEDYLLGFAGDFDCSNIVEKFEGKNVLREKELDRHLDIIKEYDDYIFWDELARRMALRDLIKQYGKENVAGMEMRELIEKQSPIEEKYWQEFEENGIDHLEIKK